MMARKGGDSYSRFPMSFGDAIAALFRPKPKRKIVPPAQVTEFPAPEVQFREAEEQDESASVANEYVAQRTD